MILQLILQQMMSDDDGGGGGGDDDDDDDGGCGLDVHESMNPGLLLSLGPWFVLDREAFRLHAEGLGTGLPWTRGDVM